MIGWDLLEAAGAQSKYNNENEKVLIQDIFNTAVIYQNILLCSSLQKS